MPNLLLRTFLVLSLPLMAIACAPLAHADDAQCLAAVKEKQYARMSSVCLVLPHRDRLKKMQMLMQGGFEHHLGSLVKPTEAFQTLKKHASTGDVDAQYVYGELFGSVHLASATTWSDHPANRGNRSMQSYNAKIRAEAAKWTRRAASGGHSLAQLEVAESLLLKSYTDSDIDLAEALRNAGAARDENPVLADALLVRIKSRIKEQE